MARTVWLQIIEDSAFLRSVVTPDEVARIRAELEEAAGLLVRDLDKSGSPSLCHGVAGGALVLDLAGRQLGRRDWREATDDLVARGGATLSRCPWMLGKHDVRDFGIMTGPGRWRRTAPAGPGTHRWYGRYGMRIVLQQSEQDCLLAC